jgi:hypothetical protein
MENFIILYLFFSSKMYHIITYVEGPLENKTFGQWLTRKQGNDLYHLNPQLYMNDLPNALMNFDVFEMITKRGEINSDELLESRVNSFVKSALGSQIEVGKKTISIGQIEFSVERVKE